MSIATLGDLITKIRRLSSSGSSYQLTDAAIIQYINSFYLYDFPAKFRSLKLKDRYTFNTVRGIDVYAFDNVNYTTIEPPAYVAKKEVMLYTDPWSFFSVNFNWQYQTNFSTGNGTPGPYTGFTTSAPIVRSVNNTIAAANVNRVQNILITANAGLGSTYNVTDDGFGNLIGDCLAGGTINYLTGAISVTFTGNVPTGEVIRVQYNPTNMTKPLAILFYQQQFTLRPIPDAGYTIELVAYRLPTAVFNEVAPTLTATPELMEWWECIAFGAAKKIYEDRMDLDGVAMMDKALAERYDHVETRTYAQLGKGRIQTMFTDQLTGSYNSAIGWFGGAS